MIDFTKPIETTPCELNPLPVECKVHSVCEGGESAKILIFGNWLDSDGENMHGWLGTKKHVWVARAADGAFIALNGSVRNAI